MPFLGKDWRSPGEAWVKTSEGWERKKILEHKTSHGQTRFSRSRGGKQLECVECEEESADFPFQGADIDFIGHSVMDFECQPHCQITLKNTKEVIAFNNIGEAIQKLDFRNAVHDIRRFNYICKLLHLLITQNLTTLSGRATQILFAVLEEIARQVARDHQNVHVLRALVEEVRRCVRTYHCWGRPLGSTVLWQRHLATLDRIAACAHAIRLQEPSDDNAHTLSDMPSGILREILLRLSDYRDLGSCALALDEVRLLVGERHVWRQLAKFHFSPQQISAHLPNPEASDTDWQLAFHQLRRKHGLKEEYAESLFLCRYCRCLFWKSFGHPCVDRSLPGDVNFVDETNGSLVKSVPLYIPVPPQAFLDFFSL